MVELDDAGRAHRRMGFELDAGRARQHRQEVGQRVLQEVDLARDERGLRGLWVGHPHELDAVDLGDLAARMPRGRFLARDVVVEPDIDRLAARDPFVALEGEGAGADGLLDLLERIHQRFLLAHDEGDAGAALGERVEQEPVWGRQVPREGPRVDRLEPLRLREELPAGAVALAPALQRGDHVARRDGAAVVEAQPLAQGEAVGAAILAHGPALDHLRLRLELVVAREERVVDHHAVDAGDGLRGPEGIERADIRMHDDFQRLLLLRGGGHRRREEAEGEGAAGKGRGDGRDPGHSCSLSLVVFPSVRQARDRRKARIGGRFPRRGFRAMLAP